MAYAGYGPGRCNCQFSKAYNWGFQPRLGFAYRIGQKTVLRGGWGLTYGQTANYNYISNTPIVGVGFNQLSFNSPGSAEPDDPSDRSADRSWSRAGSTPAWAQARRCAGLVPSSVT